MACLTMVSTVSAMYVYAYFQFAIPTHHVQLGIQLECRCCLSASSTISDGYMVQLA